MALDEINAGPVDIDLDLLQSHFAAYRATVECRIFIEPKPGEIPTRCFYFKDRFKSNISLRPGEATRIMVENSFWLKMMALNDTYSLENDDYELRPVIEQAKIDEQVEDWYYDTLAKYIIKAMNRKE